ncbi:B12-binding domain-containing radical SAM protein [Candidatus Omnitrophota bacterium]
MRLLFVQANGLSEMIGFANISAYLKHHGHQVDLLLLSHAKDWLKEIKEFQPDLLGFSAFTGMHKSVFETAAMMKKRLGVPVIIGGPHPTFYPECIEQYPGIDFICSGEGEQVLLDLFKAMQSGSDYTSIPGLAVRTDQQVIYNGAAAINYDIERVPLPDRDIYFSKYKFLADIPMKRFIAGYGCPFDCTFCHQPIMRGALGVAKSKFMRQKSVTRVIQEIEYLRDKYPLKRVHFSDDLFALNSGWLEQFAREYKQRINIPYSCNIRFDMLTENTVKLLKGSNCVAAQVGLESGNEDLRNLVLKKKVSNEQAIKGAGMLKRHGIKLFTTNIIGLPGETLENSFETVKLNHKIKANYIRINTLMAYPRTEIYEQALKQGYIEPYSWDDMTSDALKLHCKTPYQNEFKNITTLFYYMIKFPKMLPLFKKLIKLKHNWIYKWLGIINIVQETLYFDIPLYRGFIFFKNTILKSSIETNLHWVPFNLSYLSKKPKAKEF